MDDVWDRIAARLVPVDPDGRILLLHGIDLPHPDEPFWFTIGGQLEPGESAASAAAREAWEEVGLDLDATLLGGPAWSGVADFSLGGKRVRNTQDFFVVRVDLFEPDPAGRDALELATICGHRWWPLAELVLHQLDPTGPDPVFPPDLGSLLTAHLGAAGLAESDPAI